MSNCPNCNSKSYKKKKREGFLKFIPMTKKYFCSQCPTRFSKFTLSKNHYIILKNY